MPAALTSLQLSRYFLEISSDHNQMQSNMLRGNVAMNNTQPKEPRTLCPKFLEPKVRPRMLCPKFLDPGKGTGTDRKTQSDRRHLYRYLGRPPVDSLRPARLLNLTKARAARASAFSAFVHRGSQTTYRAHVSAAPILGFMPT